MGAFLAPGHVQATSPGKVILFGEHSVSRGQAAIAASVGLMTTCDITVHHSGSYLLTAGGRVTSTTREQVIQLARRVEEYRRQEDYPGLQAMAHRDFFAPSLYLIASALGPSLPAGMTVRFSSNIPVSAGLGSGAAAFVALARGLAALCAPPAGEAQAAEWAHLGEVIAHGGVASKLDTQACFYGGVIKVTAGGSAPLAYDPALTLVIGDTGIYAPTNPVKALVRDWLAEAPHRLHVFQEIGLLSGLAESALGGGDWERLGGLMNLNHMLLREIGVSCPELDDLVEAALAAGAYGAKLSGSGGGGIMIALVHPDRAGAVAAALGARGATVYQPVVGVRGALRSEPCEEPVGPQNGIDPPGQQSGFKEQV